MKSRSLTRTDRSTANGPGIDWEETSCLHCGGKHSHVVLEAADNEEANPDTRFAIVQCEECGLRYTNPRPTAESMGRFYPDDYTPHRQPSIGDGHLNWIERLSARVFGRPCIERHRLDWHGQGRLLDFGCGGGDFLLRMHDQGWKVTALDFSEKVIGKLRQEFGLNGRVGTLPNADLANESFDVVTMWASLEHVHEPLAVLKDVRRILAPGGRLYIQVPNIDSWDVRLFGKHSHLLELPRHLVHFNSRTLRKMLVAAGFEARTVRTQSHPSWIKRTLRIAKHNRAIGLLPRLIGVNPFHRWWSTLAYWTGGGDGLFALAEKPTH